MALWDIKVAITLFYLILIKYIYYHCKFSSSICVPSLTVFENHRAKQLDYLFGSSLNFKILISQNTIIFLALCLMRLCNLLEVLLENIDPLWFLGPLKLKALVSKLPNLKPHSPVHMLMKWVRSINFS